MQEGTTNTPCLDRDENVGSKTQSSAALRAPRRPPTPEYPARAKRRWIPPTALLVALVLAGVGLTLWKAQANQQAMAASANQPEHAEVVTVATAEERQHRRTTTSVGTVVALRSISLRNEVAGTVAETHLTPGRIVEPGEVLVAMDVSVEEAELRALQAQAALAKTLAERMERAVRGRATSQIELDRARSEVDVANAQIARTEAVIARKTIRAPFRARVGLSDVHPGQYLNEGTLITTLQGVDQSTQVDFAVPQQVAQTLEIGESVEVLPGNGRPSVEARIAALDARIDASTRNTWVRALVADASSVPPPGASVRVEVPTSPPFSVVTVPVNAARKGPSGDHVFVIVEDEQGQPRAQTRPVKTGPSLGDEILILSGLEAGERVAASGSFKLQEHILVSIAPAPSEHAAK